MSQDNKPNRDALVVGITQYADLPMPPEITQLADGAEQIAQRLETQGGFRVRRLPVTKPGEKEFVDPEQMLMAAQLKDAIIQLFTPESDNRPTTALLFFAGHGLRQKFNEDHYQGFLATSEANPNENNWGLSLQWLRELLDKSLVQQQIVWLDACHSGELINEPPQQTEHDRCFISSARPFEEAYAEGVLTKALLETVDYTKQLNPWVDHLTLIEWLEAKNQTAVGSQRFVFEKTDKPIILTNKAFDIDADYKNVCPFKGLESFDFEKNPDDPLYFKGRTQLTDELLDKIKGTNFLAVLGASGNGKSSVVRAGLLYQLRQTQRWEILPVITPTTDPLKALGAVIGMPAAQLTDFINSAQAARLVLVIDQFEEVFTLCKNDAQREHFFATLLAAVARADNKFCLVVVMRADFLDKCSHYVDLAKKIQAHQIIVTPMTRAELEEAIVAPTQQVGLQIEPKLVSEMLADVKGALGSLPLLQYALTELWKKCATQRLLTFSAYEALGKIAGTLEQGANGVYQELSPAEQKTAKRIFIELTRLGEGSPDTRRQLSQQDLVTSLPFESAPVNQVIQKLVAANLVVTDKPKEEQVAVVNIAHEALTQHWGQLRGWLDGNREAIKIQRDIEADAKKWQDSNKYKDALLQGLDLNIAEDYAKTHTEKVPLSPLAQDFVQLSVKRQRNLKWSIRVSVVAVILVLAGIAFYANVQRIVAEEQRIEADEQRIKANRQREAAKIAQSKAEKSEQVAKEQAKITLVEKLGAQSILATHLPSAGNGYYEQALLLAIQAFKEKDIGTSRSNLLRVLQAKKQRKFFLYGHYDNINSMAFSPDGKFLASGSSDETVRLWNLDTGKPLGEPLDGHYDRVNSVAFSPDGKTLASASYDTVILWDVETRKPLGEPLDGDYGFSSVAFSPDGKLLASGSYLDNNVILWDVDTKKPLGELLVGDYGVSSLVFSPEGKLLASVSRDSAILWDVDSQKPLGELLVGSFFPVPSVAFSPDGKTFALASSDTVILWNVDTQKKVGEPLASPSRIASSVAFNPGGSILAWGGSDKTVRLWHVYSQQPGKPLVGHSSYVWSMAFSPDGKTLASGGKDKIVLSEVWDVDTQKPLIGEPLLAGDPLIKELGYGLSMLNFNNVLSVALSPDSNILASGSSDHTVILWDVDTQKPLGEPLTGHSDRVNSVAFSPDGKTLASGSSDNTVILWDVDTGQPLGEPLAGHYRSVSSVAFSPDGKTFASGSGDNTVILWDVDSQKQHGEPLAGHSDSVMIVAFSPDGKTLASGSSDKTVRLWNVDTQKLLGELLADHSNSVTSVAFSLDGKTLASGSLGNTVRLWDVDTQKPLYEPLVGYSSVPSVAFNSYGNKLFALSGSIMMRLGDIDSKSWVKKACAIVNRNFSQQEWQHYMGNRPHEKTCPDLPKDTLGAIELTRQAIELLKEGKTELAKAKFAQAKELDANVVFGEELTN